METDSDHPPPKALLVPLLLLVPTNAVIMNGLLAIIFLLLVLILLVATKVAFCSLTPHDLAKLSEEKSLDSLRVLALRKKPRHVAATLLVSSNLILIGIILLANLLVQQLFATPVLRFWADGMPQPLAISYSQQNIQSNWMQVVHFSLTAALVASSVLIFNESMPRWYVPRNKLQLVKWMSAPLLVLVKVLHPFNILLLNTTKVMERRWGKSTPQKKEDQKEEKEETFELVAGMNGEKNTTEPEYDILKSIAKFSDVTVRQIMMPRMDVVAIDEKNSYAALLDIIQESGYSRIPVYEDDFDNIKGILYVKDLLRHIHEGADFNWQTLVRTNVLYVPEAKKIHELLREFQKQRLHLAIVVDEYGGSAGIVTLEDVLEEIIGDIKDEFDDEAEVQYRQLDDHTYLFEGKTLLQDVYRLTGIESGTFDEARKEADSLAGLILAIYGQIPKKDTELSYQNFHFKIIAVNKRRIEQVQLTINDGTE